MDYKMRLLYEKLTNGNLVIGKFTLVKGIPIQEYDYDKSKGDKSIISTATQKNLDLLERKAGAVFTKIYKADKSKGRGAMSTYILGTLHTHPNDKLNNREFIWAREEGSSSMSGTTKAVFDDHKISGQEFVGDLALDITKVGNLYKIVDEKAHKVTYSTDPNGSNLHRDDGPAYTSYYPNGSIKEERWYTDDHFNRDSTAGPAVIHYNKKGKIISYTYWRNGTYHRPTDEGPAQEYNIGDSDTIITYYQNGKCHRIDGYASEGNHYISYDETDKAVYINGIHIFSISESGEIKRGRQFE